MPKSGNIVLFNNDAKGCDAGLSVHFFNSFRWDGSNGKNFLKRIKLQKNVPGLEPTLDS